MAADNDLPRLAAWLKEEVDEYVGTINGTHHDLPIRELGDMFNVFMAIVTKRGHNLLDVVEAAYLKSVERSITKWEDYAPLFRLSDDRHFL